MTVDGLKALSVRQPWAWALIHAGKDVENRSTAAIRNMNLSSQHRLAIHAARGMTRTEYKSAVEFMQAIDVECPAARDLVRGAIIGSVTVIDVVRVFDSPWFFGPRGIVVGDPRACAPIPAVGALGIFNWTQGGETAAPNKWMLAEPAKIVPEPEGLFG